MDWREQAACRHVEADTFFPLTGKGPDSRQIARAKAVCAACPVTLRCAAWALETAQPYGVWGGMDEGERRRLLRERRRAAHR